MSSSLPGDSSGLVNPYSSFLELIEKPARYIGGEHFIKRKSWGEDMAKVCLAFPDVYEIGMSHLGYKILYDELNRHPQILAERTYAPWIDMEKAMRERQLPLVTLENFKPLSEFEVLGFSLQYEMTFTTIINMLDLGGISHWQKDRTENEPFVIAGGPVATHPEPLAPFMDFIVVGDGEDLFTRLALAIHQARKEKKKRAEILRELSKWDGIYVPSLYSTKIDELTDFEVIDQPLFEDVPKIVKRFFVPNLKDYPIPTDPPIPHMTAIFDRHSVELARGCTEGCRFCQAGMIYRPVRERRPEDVIASVISGVQKGGFDEASLTCLSTADYSAITPLLLELLDKMKENHATLGISSLRAYGLDKRIFDKMAEVKNSSLTFAPEAGTDRMRKVINKNITEKDMMNTAYDVFQRGWHKMKLYFMIGLPTETDEDVKAIMETGFKAREVARKCGVRSPSITISASSFVPKPHTPFQWCAMISYSEIERKQEMLWGLSKAYKLNFRKHLSKTSAMECLIARGDRSIAPVIYSAWKKGARFDGWNETFSFSLWMEAIEEHDVDLAKYLGTIRLDGRLPWDHIDVGLEEKFLVREWKKALKDRLSPPCGKPAGAIIHHSTLDALVKTHEVERKRLVCYACGVACDLEGMIEERKEYLTSLKSFSEIPYVEPENMGLDISKRREKRQQNIGFKYRLEFTKIGSISFISHLDLQKVMARIFKRLGVQVLYSEGYNPRPLFSFGPALSLGISSLSEWFDIRVEEKFIDLEKMLQNLNQQSEKGIIFHSMVEVEKKALSIQEAITAYQYFIPVDDLKEHEVFMHFKNSEVLAIESLDRKTGDKMAVNLKNELLDITTGALDLAQSDWVDVIDEVSPCKGKKGYFVTARSTQGRTLKPRDIQSYFDQFGCQAYRPIKVGSKLSANISP